MFKEKTGRILLALGIGTVFGITLSVISLDLVYYFRGGERVLKQDLISYYFLDAARQPETFLAMFGFIFLGIALFMILFLWEEIQIKSRENQGLKEESLAKTEFTSFIVHELRSPLSSLRFSFTMLQEGEFGPLNSKQVNVIQNTSREIFILINLVENLLDVTKIEIHQIVAKKNFIRLRELQKLIGDFVRIYSPIVEKENIAFNYQFLDKDASVFVYIDWSQIKQALNNLLDNALNYTLAGGRIDLKIYLKEKNLIFSVSDTGIGIPQDEQKNIFTKFYRASNAKRKQNKGTGIGLYLTKFFIDSHKGRLWFDSKEGRGTTFYFALPIAEETEEFLRET